jgi:hypothetical protein
MVSHCDDEDLSLLALGETVSAVDEAHLATCGMCQNRLDQLSAVVKSARTVTADDHPLPAPAGVWAGISGELGLGSSADDAGSVTAIDQARQRRRPRVWLVAVAAAAVGIVVGGGAVAVIGSTTTSDQLVASTTLGPIDDSGFAGTASIEKGTGGASLTVDVPGLPAVADGYYEVWMATPDTATMVAIGTMRPGEPATFSLPPGLDPSTFPVVDVSVEHFDGQAGHSAISVVRGQLST